MLDKETILENEFNRRQLLKGAGLGVTALSLGGFLAGCGGSGVSTASSTDATILGAAKIAEALATAMYTGIIGGAVFGMLSGNAPDQAYLTAARDEEKYHYDLLKSSTGGTDAQTTYYFPTGMFTDKTVTINTLVTLEDAFISAYLIGVNTLSTPALKVLAAQIMGVEAEHRVLARVIANDLSLPSTTGLSGSPEAVMPSNNVVYERRFGLTTINQVVNALTPFLSSSSSNPVAAPFDPTYVPTTASLQGNPPS